MAYTKKQRQDIFTEQTPFSKNLCIFAPNKILMIKHDKRNYRKHSDRNKELINKSLSEVGAGRSILIDNENEIIAGNGVFEQWGDKPIKIIESDGSELIVVKRTDLSTEDPKRKQLAIMDNSASDSSEFDLELLCEDFESFELESFGVDLPTMEAEVLEAEEDDFDVPEGGLETDIVLGDLFEIGEHRLLCGDSTQTDTFVKLFNGQMADMVVTDPPYNVAYEGKTKNKLTIENDKQGDKDFYQFLYDFYTAQATVCKMGGAWYVWHDDSEGANFRQAMKDSGIMVKQCLIWIKNSMVMGRQDYQWKHEPCLYGWKEGAAHGWYSDRKQTTVLNFDRPQRNAEHPTMKPIPLFAYQIGNSSKQGDIVADAFGGSGTTMVACHQMNRKAYLVEFDPKYCQVIVDRMRKLDPTIKIKKNGELI